MSKVSGTDIEPREFDARETVKYVQAEFDEEWFAQRSAQSLFRIFRLA